MAELPPLSPPVIEGVVLPLGQLAVHPEAVEHARSAGFQLKDELHLTVASASYMNELTAKQRELFHRLVQSEPRPSLDYQDVLYRVAKPKMVEGKAIERETLIAPVFSPQVEQMLGAIAAQLEVAPPQPFLHVTLFTRPDNTVARRGIGIASAEEWNALRPDAPFILGWQA